MSLYIYIYVYTYINIHTHSYMYIFSSHSAIGVHKLPVLFKVSKGREVLVGRHVHLNFTAKISNFQSSFYCFITGFCFLFKDQTRRLISYPISIPF